MMNEAGAARWGYYPHPATCQAEIGVALGVARETVRNWLIGDGQSAKTYKKRPRPANLRWVNLSHRKPCRVT